MPIESPPTTTTRRRFLKTAAFAAPLGFPAITRCASPNGKLQHASIGVGGMGFNDLRQFKGHRNTEIVAICDIDSNNLARGAKAAPGARKYQDWREMLESEGDKIDSINVTVPDHMHASIAMKAISAGKHVYCQKPMCHDVAEVRALTNAAVKAGVVSQLGTQHASGAGNQIGVHWLQEGVIGKVKRVIFTANRPGAVKAYRLKGPRPERGDPVPAHLAWDLFLGTAPEREFANGIYHPTVWRAWQDFGTGWSGDIGCHLFDAAWKGLEMSAKTPPKTVVARADESWTNDAARRADTWSQASHITWVFPGTDITDGDVTMEWFDGAFFPPEEVRVLYPGPKYPEVALFIGTKGAMLLPNGGGPMLLPGESFKVTRPKTHARNHYHHFADACLGGEMCESHFAQTGPMTEAILLGTVAILHAGTLLEWDAANLNITNHEPANAHLRRTYRKGWEIEGLG